MKGEGFGALYKGFLPTWSRMVCLFMCIYYKTKLHYEIVFGYTKMNKIALSGNSASLHHLLITDINDKYDQIYTCSASVIMKCQAKFCACMGAASHMPAACFADYTCKSYGFSAQQ